MRTALLTGDRPEVAAAVARQTGVDECLASQTPSTKRAFVEGAQRPTGIVCRQRVLMLGDGVNDGPALQTAWVGVAMASGGAELAVLKADVAVLDDELGGVLALAALSRACARTVRANVAIAMGLKAVVVIAALCGVAQLWHAIVADVGGLMLVAANGLRLLAFDFETAKKGADAPAGVDADADAARDTAPPTSPDFVPRKRSFDKAYNKSGAVAVDLSHITLRPVSAMTTAGLANGGSRGGAHDRQPLLINEVM